MCSKQPKLPLRVPFCWHRTIFVGLHKDVDDLPWQHLTPPEVGHKGLIPSRPDSQTRGGHLQRIAPLRIGTRSMQSNL